MTRLDRAESSLKQAGMRMTSTRHAILSLLSDTDHFFSIDDIARQSSERKMDTVTVYRIMQTLEDLQLVYKLLSVNAYVAIEDARSYRFLIDPVKQYVQKQARSPFEHPGFLSHRQHCEIVGSFAALHKDSGSSTASHQDQKTPQTYSPKEEKLTHISPPKATPPSQQQSKKQYKKNLHQKLKEF